MADEKVIQMILKDGTMDGQIWLQGQTCEVLVVPRENLADLDGAEGSKFGVYLLLSETSIYVGQASDLLRRLGEHDAGKDWWTHAVLLMARDDGFTHAHIDAIEAKLITGARKGRLACENKTKGCVEKLGKVEKIKVRQYLEEAMLVLPILGVTAFQPREPLGDHARLKAGKKQKTTAVRYLGKMGFSCGEHLNYSVLQDGETWFWMNPRAEMLSHDWTIVLNDNQKEELILLEVPAGSLSLEGDGFHTRTDKPYYLDMHIEVETLLERRSGVDLSRFCKARVSYGTS